MKPMDFEHFMKQKFWVINHWRWKMGEKGRPDWGAGARRPEEPQRRDFTDFQEMQKTKDSELEERFLFFSSFLRHFEVKNAGGFRGKPFV